MSDRITIIRTHQPSASILTLQSGGALKNGLEGQVLGETEAGTEQQLNCLIALPVYDILSQPPRSTPPGTWYLPLTAPNPNPQTLPQLHILYNTYCKGLKAPGFWGTKAPSYSYTYYSSTYELLSLPFMAALGDPQSWNPISVQYMYYIISIAGDLGDWGTFIQVIGFTNNGRMGRLFLRIIGKMDG